MNDLPISVRSRHPGTPPFWRRPIPRPRRAVVLRFVLIFVPLLAVSVAVVGVLYAGRDPGEEDRAKIVPPPCRRKHRHVKHTTNFTETFNAGG